MAIAGKKALRSKLGDFNVANHLTRALAESPKCRTACDLLMWLDPPRAVLWEEVEAAFCKDATAESLELIEQRASAWQSVVARSVYRRGRWIQLTQGDANRRDQLLEMSGCPPLVKFIVRRGNSTDSLNSLMVPVFQLGQLKAERFDLIDLNPSSIDAIGQIPAYAYCLFSGPGRAALRVLLASTPSLVRFCVGAGIVDPLRATGHTIFQLEGGYCQRVWEVARGMDIKFQSEQATLERFGVAREFQGELRGMVHALLPRLNLLRKQVWEAGRHSSSVREQRPDFGICSQQRGAESVIDSSPRWRHLHGWTRSDVSRKTALNSHFRAFEMRMNKPASRKIYRDVEDSHDPRDVCCNTVTNAGD
jgi:hypothetical protein